MPDKMINENLLVVVHDVLSFSRAKTVHDVLNPDTYHLRCDPATV